MKPASSCGGVLSTRLSHIGPRSGAVLGRRWPVSHRCEGIYKMVFAYVALRSEHVSYVLASADDVSVLQVSVSRIGVVGSSVNTGVQQ